MSRPLRIATFAGAFPVVSETFILQQVTGLMDLGQEVDIYADVRADLGGPIHSEVAAYGLLDRTTYMDMPPECAPWEMPVWPLTQHTWPPGAATSIANWRRVARALPRWLRCVAASPALALRVLQQSEYGYRAASLSALYRLDKLRPVHRRYDVLHAHFGPIANAYRFARALWQAPLVVTFHGYDFCVTPREEGPSVYRRLFQEVDAVTVNSRYTRDRLVDLGCPPERIHILHVGVDVSRFALQDRPGRPDGAVRIITVGRLVQKKGIEIAIRAVASVLEKHPNVHLDIIGEGPLRQRLQQLTNELGLQNHVTLQGAKDSRFIQEQLAQADIFMLPSITADNGDQEGTPVSLMEAQAVGLPVLSTLHSGIPEVVLDGQSGFLVPESDVAALADRLQFLVEHPDVCRAMGARGRHHIEREFDLRRLNRDLVGIYRQTADQFRRPVA